MERLFSDNPSFRNVYVKGEVSNKYISPRGHLYFTLKDKNSHVPCIVYQWFIESIGFEIENGMKLLITANVTVYWPHGKYQLDVRSATDEGLGKLFIAYRQLREKLEKEGLFEDKHKKELPNFPKRIGVVTSKGGAVIHDIIKTVEKKWPYCEVILFPASVQGINSKSELTEQIKRADQFGMDVLIIGRGGGSLEDLWSFNEEIVVRTIFNCRTPVITAIGHEDDTTLSDLVSDKRASTPTMAASLAVEDKNEILSNINHLNSRLMTFISTKIDANRKEFESILSRAVISDSSNVYDSKRKDFDLLCSRFDVASNGMVISCRHGLSKIKSSYSIRHPCKMQLDSSRSQLSELQRRLVDAMNSIINNYRVNLDKTADKFHFQSDKLITFNRNRLNEIINSYFIQNPCKIQLDYSVSLLNSANGRLCACVEDIRESNVRDFDELKNRFFAKSNEIILTGTYRLDSLKASPAIRRHLTYYCESCSDKLGHLNARLERSFRVLIDDSQKDLDIVLNKNVIRNPYVMLDSHKQKLSQYEEKLDRINQVNVLEMEKQKEKSRMIGIIVAIVIVFMMIILLLILGGI